MDAVMHATGVIGLTFYAPLTLYVLAGVVCDYVAPDARVAAWLWPPERVRHCLFWAWIAGGAAVALAQGWHLLGLAP